MDRVGIHYKGEGNFYKVFRNVSEVWVRNSQFFIRHVFNGVETTAVYPLDLFDFNVY